MVQEELKFRGVEFAVKVELQDRSLAVEISDILTADQWGGEFDPACTCALHYIHFELNFMFCLDFSDLFVAVFSRH